MLRRRPKKTAGRYRLYCNLGYNLSEEVVRRYFQQICTHGQILDVYIPRHNSGRNKGYGFTTFENEADLLTALQVRRISCIVTSTWRLQPHNRATDQLASKTGIQMSGPERQSCCTILQTAEHVIGGNVVKINRAGPRPDFEGNEGDQVRSVGNWDR
jgi:RNA recognition motif-containing protein